ncbi:hypothetical protein NQ318_023341 [Aromia moschata]|uniref:Uncharacterized protein n=1 Tax=Aromia moschata TaxID=1265417 RepID=A0AAV8X249_9CUCU|nr:hypothetical protein NQ318_023341 [Aromia moschata]
MTNNVTFDNNRYCVSLPWKDQCVGVDSNFNGALNRLKSLTRRLANTGIFEEYDYAIREYIDNDCAELSPRVPDSNKTYFMPHRAVYRDDKDTSRIRVVFDASAHAPSLPSLNDVLLQGENLVPNLLRMLMNHRVEKDNGEVDCRWPADGPTTAETETVSLLALQRNETQTNEPIFAIENYSSLERIFKNYRLFPFCGIKR